MATDEQRIRENAAEAMRRAEAEDEVLVTSFSRHTPPMNEEGSRWQDNQEEGRGSQNQCSSVTTEELNDAAAEAMRKADLY